VTWFMQCVDCLSQHAFIAKVPHISEESLVRYRRQVMKMLTVDDTDPVLNIVAEKQAR
jgi:hypothetical protein